MQRGLTGAQGNIGLLTLGDVAGNTKQAINPALLIKHRPLDDQKHPLLAIEGADVLFQCLGLAAGDDLSIPRHHVPCSLGREQKIVIPPHYVTGRAPGHLRRCCIDKQIAALNVLDENRIRSA